MALSKLTDWPLVICGPILRRVTEDSVSVFVVLKEFRNIKLTLYKLVGSAYQEIVSSPPIQPIKPTQLGKRLYVSVVTAEMPPSELLVPGRIYAYDLVFIVGTTTETLRDLPQFLGDASLGYGIFDRPTFVLPSNDIGQLKFFHASCRLPHGDGIDAFVKLDKELNDFPLGPTRPQQLFLTGDQIYADDVHPSILRLAQNVGELALGIGEDGRVHENISKSTAITTKQLNLAAGHRQEYLSGASGRQVGGLTSGHSLNHLVSLAEYYGMYLLAWSDVLWPKDSSGSVDLPDIQEVLNYGDWGLDEYRDTFPDAYWELLKAYGDDIPDAFRVEYYRVRIPRGGSIWIRGVDQGQGHELRTPENEKSRKKALNYGQTLKQVRKILANIPTYMIFDDHEVTDDWNLHREWREGLDAADIGPRVLSNGLSAYAVFQAWGNQPNHFVPGQPGGDVIDALKKRYNNETGWEGELDSALSKTNWYYDIEFPVHHLVVLDTRTGRDLAGTPNTDKDAAPALIELGHLDQQLPDTITTPLTILVSAAPILGHPFVERVVQDMGVNVVDWIGKNLQIVNDIGGAEMVDREAWGANSESYEFLLSRLAEFDSKITILSGDVHYSFSAVMDYWASNTGVQRRFIQLTSSALHNHQDSPKWIDRGTRLPLLRILHRYLRAESELRSFGWTSSSPEPTVIKTFLLPQPNVTVSPIPGNPPVLLATSFVQGHFLWGSFNRQPDWVYRSALVKDTRLSDEKGFLDASQNLGNHGKQRAANAHKKISEHERPVVVGKFPNIARVTFTQSAGNITVIHELFFDPDADDDTKIEDYNPQPLTRHVISFTANSSQKPQLDSAASWSTEY